MNKNNPFLTGFPTAFFGSKKRTIQDNIRAKRNELASLGLSDFALLFQSLLPALFLNEMTFDKRKRVYTEVVVFWAWLSQVLLFNESCRKAVSLVRSGCVAHGLEAPSAETGAYCQARKRLRLEFLEDIFTHITKALNRRIRPQDLWKGMVVKSIDGSSVQTMDTPENQKAYPQPTTQKKGCGFPVIGVAGVLNHAHGGWEGYVTSVHTEHDHKVADRLLKYFEKGDLALADTAYSSYELICRFAFKGVHVLMPPHQARKIKFNCGVKIGKNQRLMTFKKPRKQPKGSVLSESEWSDLPETMQMRVIRFWYTNKEGKQCKKHLVTTLLDVDQYPWEELVALYLERWDIELRFRDVKTTMGFEELNVKTPDMAKKALAMAMIGCNLIKSVSQEAAGLGDSDIRKMSFKGTLDEITSNSSNFRGHSNHPHKCQDLYEKMLYLVADQLLNIRPFRYEPRVIKKRPKPFGRMTKPRGEYKASVAA